MDQPLDDSPELVLLESLLEGLAEYYSKNLAREVMKGMKENAYQVRFNGGWAPLGFDIIEGQYVVNEKEALIIRLIFSMFLQGHGYRKIQDKMNELGHQTKQKYLSATQGNTINRSDLLAKKKIVDLYVHEIKAFSDKVDVTLKLNLGADKDGVGGGT